MHSSPGCAPGPTESRRPWLSGKGAWAPGPAGPPGSGVSQSQALPSQASAVSQVKVRAGGTWRLPHLPNSFLCFYELAMFLCNQTSELRDSFAINASGAGVSSPSLDDTVMPNRSASFLAAPWELGCTCFEPVPY